MTLKTRGSPDQKDLFFARCHAKVKLSLQTLSQAILKFSNNENHVLMSLQRPSPRCGTLFWLWTPWCNLTKKHLILVVSFQDSTRHKWVWVILEFGSLFCSKNVSCFDGETHNISSIHKTKPAKTTHLLRKGEKTTCIKSVLAPLTKVIPSGSKTQSSPLSCRAPAARPGSTGGSCALLQLPFLSAQTEGLWSEKEEVRIAIAKRRKLKFNLSKGKNPVATWLVSYWSKQRTVTNKYVSPRFFNDTCCCAHCQYTR